MESRVRVKVGFMTPPGSRRPAKLRGVAKGVAKFAMVIGVGKERITE